MWFERRIGREALDKALLTFSEDFPGIEVYRRKQKAAEWLAKTTKGVPHRAVALEEMLMLWLANANPAFLKIRGTLRRHRTEQANGVRIDDAGHSKSTSRRVRTLGPMSKTWSKCCARRR